MKEEFVLLSACPACAGRSILPHKKKTIDFGKLDADRIRITDSEYGKIWDLSRCRECDHVFANPCPSPEYIFSLYGSVEDPIYEEESEGRARNFRSILLFLERLIPEKGPLFDVGAATGILLDEARKRGWTAGGVEASGWAVKVAQEKYGLSLYPGSFENAALKESSWAAVTMVDFIEHTPLPFEAMAKASEILRPSGILCLVTPDIRSPAARVAGGRWWHLRPAHLAFFSRNSLQALFKRTGFRVIAERRYAWTFSAHYLASRGEIFRPLLRNRSLSSFLKKIPIKLALGDSFEIYAGKEPAG